MTMSKYKAANKKYIYMNKKKVINNNQKFKNQYDSDDSDDSDGSISSDDVESLEEEYLGYIINDQYIIIKYIGKGTFSKVWLIFDLIYEKFNIFKIYFGNNDKEEFETELKTLDIIKTNNIKNNLNYEGHLIHEFNINKKKQIGYILIMPYLGLSLADILDNVEHIPLKETKYIIKQILYSLQELHKHKYVHTDLKTDNILTNIYLEKNTEYIKWFKKIDVCKQYNTILKNNSPSDEDMMKLNKNKRKLLKRKIKKRSIKEISSFLKKKMNCYQIDLLNMDSIDFNKYLDNEKYQNTSTEDTINLNNIIEDIDLNIIDLNEISKEQMNNNNIKVLETNEEYDIINTNFTLIDYSNAIHIDEIDNDDELQIRAYRSPENILGIKYNFQSELWAVGCILWDILTRDYIFEPELIGSFISRDIEQLSLMEKYLGRIPTDMSFECKRFYELFDDSGKIKTHHKINRTNLEKFLKEKRHDLKDEQILEICTFLRKIWIYNPTNRFNMNQIINDEFLSSV